MNIRQSLILSLTVAAFAAPGISSATSAYNTGAMSYQQNSQGSKTRAEVVHELALARQEGTLVNNVSRSDSIAQRSLGTEKTRAQVVSDLKAARDNGIFTNNIENNYSLPQEFAGMDATRTQIKRELVIARAHGLAENNISRN
jgi:hypothetical protein